MLMAKKIIQNTGGKYQTTSKLKPPSITVPHVVVGGHMGSDVYGPYQAHLYDRDESKGVIGYPSI